MTLTRACVCHTTTGLDDDGRCRRHPVDTWPAPAAEGRDDDGLVWNRDEDDDDEDGLFPAPPPPGLTPADLDVPDDRWRRNARARRGSS